MGKTKIIRAELTQEQINWLEATINEELHNINQGIRDTPESEDKVVLQQITNAKKSMLLNLRGQLHSRSEEDNFQNFFYAYMECALWSSTYGDPSKNIDEEYNVDDIDDELRLEMREDCLKFFNRFREYITMCTSGREEWTVWEQAGHDFWLTRNGHGAGFWDKQEVWGEKGQEILSNAAREFGEFDIDVDEDEGKVVRM